MCGFQPQRAFWVWTHVYTNLSANAGNTRDSGLIPESGNSPGGGHGNPLQSSCLENSMDRGAWRAAGHGIAENQTLIDLGHTLWSFFFFPHYGLLMLAFERD